MQNNSTTSNTPYDDVFRTLLNDCSELIIPLINLAFGENFKGDEKIVFYPNEMFLKQRGGSEEKRITDTNFTIFGNKIKSYHWECTSSDDKTILIRMVEYDMQLAIRMRSLEGNVLKLHMPASAILFLRHGEDTPDEMKVELTLPDGKVVDYKVKVVKSQLFTIDEIFEKKLYFLIPFYIFVYESKFDEYEENEDMLITLKKEFYDIRNKLEILVEKGELEEYTKITIEEMTNKVIQNLASKKDKVRSEVGSTMVGPTLDYEAKRILKKGISQGESNTILSGLNGGSTPEEIASVLHIPLEKVLAVQKEMLEEV